MKVCPLFSIVIPVYNVAPWLRRCVDSVLAQTRKDWECILVDDGSTDESGVICDEYAVEDPRFTVIHKSNGGLSSARNAGIEKVLAENKSEWITFIDSDDSVTPDYLESLYFAVSSTRLSVAIGGVKAIDNNGTLIYEQCEREEKVLSPEELTVRFTSLGTWAWAKLYHIADFVNIRYPVGKLYEDRFTTHLVTYKYDKLAMVNCPLYFYYRNRAGNISGDKGIKMKNSMDRISGLRCQIDYFTEHGFLRAAKKTAGLLLNWICFSMNANFLNEDKIILGRELLQCKKKYGRLFWSDANSKFRVRVALHGHCWGLFELARKIGRFVEKCGRSWRDENV